AGRRGGPFDRRDHRLWQPEDGEHHRAATLHDVAGGVAPPLPPRPVGGRSPYVYARPGSASPPPPPPPPDAPRVGAPFELLRQRRQHRLGQAVAGLRAVERQNSNVADIFPQHDRLVRGCGTAGTRGGLSFHWHRLPGTSCISLLLSAVGGRCKLPRNREYGPALSVQAN